MRNCDKLHLCDHLVLNEGAYFYKKNELEVGKIEFKRYLILY